MAVREFTDEAGNPWRVWCITPEAIHPITRAEDYLADCYALGWLVFETKAGDQKRRLCPFPSDWETVGEDSLRELLGRAEFVAPRRSTADAAPAPEAPAVRRAATPDEPESEKADLTDLTVVRTFRYPGGRFWTVAVLPHVEGTTGPVLRFTAGARNIDLKNWPRDWPDMQDNELVELLRNGAPRPMPRYTPETPRRRHNDPPTT